jgi:hypothetical protein
VGSQSDYFACFGEAEAFALAKNLLNQKDMGILTTADAMPGKTSEPRKDPKGEKVFVFHSKCLMVDAAGELKKWKLQP